VQKRAALTWHLQRLPGDGDSWRTIRKARTGRGVGSILVLWHQQCMLALRMGKMHLLLSLLVE
jgi:hypothetical protein